jgi:integrase
MTREELGLVLAALPVEWRSFFTFLGQTGLRISEAVGLQWQDVELGTTRPHIKVRRQNYKGTIKKLKTRASKREVPLTPGMVATLLELRGKHYTGEEGPVWSTRRGTPLEDHNLRTRVLRPVVQALGLEWVGFHTFRHTCASLLFEGGKDVKQVQTWLGHADPAFTLRTYVHLMDDGVGDADFLDAVVSVPPARVAAISPA